MLINKFIASCVGYGLVYALLSVFAGGADAQTSNSISTIEDLNFGAAIVTTGGTITVAPNGARTATPGIILLNDSGTTITSPAQFMISAQPGLSFSIDLPPDNQVQLFSGSDSVTLSNFTSVPPSTQTLGSGTSHVAIGATISLPSTTPITNYSGTFALTIVYE